MGKPIIDDELWELIEPLLPPAKPRRFWSDANGTPIAIILTGANRDDVTQLAPLIETIPPIRRRRARRLQAPERVYADRATTTTSTGVYCAPPAFPPRSPADNRTAACLGKVRLVVKRTHAWVHAFRSLRVRFERRTDTH